MVSKNYRFYKYICFTALCGLLSSLLAILCWYIISGVSLMDDIIDIISTFVTCWCLGGIVSMFLYSRLHNLAFYTYIFSIILFIIIILYFGEWNDTSIRGWMIAFAYGYGIVCLPVYYINTRFLVPLL